MQLAIRPHPALRRQHDRGVVERIAVALRDPRDEDEPMRRAPLEPRLARRSARHLLREPCKLVRTLEDVAARAELRQHEQPRAARGRLVDQLEGARDVPLLLPHARLELADRDPHRSTSQPSSPNHTTSSSFTPNASVPRNGSTAHAPHISRSFVASMNFSSYADPRFSEWPMFDHGS